MSGSDIPYQLRPNKFIDRQLFVEMLGRLLTPRGLEKYVYISMGGRHLIDHHAVYYQLGIDAQYSFDLDANEVKRQKLNRPTSKTVCAELYSGDLPLNIERILSKFPARSNVIVWLDYTSVNRRVQFQEAVQTLVRMKHGDVFRITINASLSSLSSDGWQEAGAVGPNEYRAACLRDQIQEFMPTAIGSVSEESLPSNLAECLELVAKAAEAVQPKLRIRPVLMTTYRDGQRMVTAAFAVSETDAEMDFPSRPYFRWKYAFRPAAKIQEIYAPLFSTRERACLDARLRSGAPRMLAALKFLPNKDTGGSLKALRSYREFHRFYPVFRSVEE